MDTNIVFSLIVIIFFVVMIVLIIYCIVNRCKFDDVNMISREDSTVNDILTRNEKKKSVTQASTEIIEI